MKRTSVFPRTQTALRFSASLLLAAIGCSHSYAYERYKDPATGSGNCFACHGDFRGPTSTKGTVFPSAKNHEMHRASTSMATACNLCHVSSTDRLNPFIGASAGTTTNPGLGCSGCHVGEGLRAHHIANGETVCLDCHTDGPAPAENVKPPYYGTIDTKANNPGNTVQVANTNENWSVGDFVGLDNDGNNLYDLADYAIGPYRLQSLIREGNDLRVTWQTAGGRVNTVQAAGAVSGSYSNVSSAIVIPGVGLVITNYLEVGGATNVARFYRMKSVVP